MYRTIEIAKPAIYIYFSMFVAKRQYERLTNSTDLDADLSPSAAGYRGPLSTPG